MQRRRRTPPNIAAERARESRDDICTDQGGRDMTLLRTYLVLAFACLGAYTLMVGMEHGWNLLPPFFEAIAQGSWRSSGA